MYRIEKDSLGEKKIPSEALYGIHSERARNNFPGNTHFPVEWYKAVGITKLACYNTYRKFRNAAESRSGKELPFKMIPEDILDSLCTSAKEVAEGKYFDHFIIPSVQGGAGTSINMNINEIIANAALSRCGHKYGDYKYIDPFEHANVYQSTNDVIPSALTVAVMKLLQALEEKINCLRQKVEEYEKKTGRDTLRCNLQSRLHLVYFSAHTMKLCRATGGGYPNVLRGSNKSTWVAEQSEQAYPCPASLLWKLSLNYAD